MVQAGCVFSRDIPPYVVAGERPLKYGGPNYTMMQQFGISEKVQKHIANAYRLVFNGQGSLFDAILQIKDQVPDSPEIQNITSFLETTQAGIMTKL